MMNFQLPLFSSQGLLVKLVGFTNEESLGRPQPLFSLTPSLTTFLFKNNS